MKLTWIEYQRQRVPDVTLELYDYGWATGRGKKKGTGGNWWPWTSEGKLRREWYTELKSTVPLYIKEGEIEEMSERYKGITSSSTYDTPTITMEVRLEEEKNEICGGCLLTLSQTWKIAKWIFKGTGIILFRVENMMKRLKKCRCVVHCSSPRQRVSQDRYKLYAVFFLIISDRYITKGKPKSSNFNRKHKMVLSISGRNTKIYKYKVTSSFHDWIYRKICY